MRWMIRRVTVSLVSCWLLAIFMHQRLYVYLEAFRHGCYVLTLEKDYQPKMRIKSWL